MKSPKFPLQKWLSYHKKTKTVVAKFRIDSAQFDFAILFLSLFVPIFPMQAMTLSHDGQHLIIGGFSAHVYVLDTHSLGLVHAYEECDSSIRALHMSHDNR